MICPNHTVKLNGMMHKVVNNRVFFQVGKEWLLSSKPAEFVRIQYKKKLQGLTVKDFEVFS